MRNQFTIFIPFAAGLSLLLAVGHTAEAKWICMKNGKTMKVTGYGTEEKKTDCEARRGTWEQVAEPEPAPVPVRKAEKKAVEPPPEPVKTNEENSYEAPAETQNSGGGGGW